MISAGFHDTTNFKEENNQRKSSQKQSIRFLFIVLQKLLGWPIAPRVHLAPFCLSGIFREKKWFCSSAWSLRLQNCKISNSFWCNPISRLIFFKYYLFRFRWKSINQNVSNREVLFEKIHFFISASEFWEVEKTKAHLVIVNFIFLHP